MGFPFVKQRDSMQCGAACLAMVCRHFGKPVSMELRSEKVRRLLGEIPPSLTRWATVIIATVFTALAAAVCLLPYPYSGGETILRHLLK